MKRYLLLLIIVITLTIPSLLYSASGKISGVVFDATTGDPLPGANIIIDGTTIGTASNTDGEYILQQIRPGTYIVKFKYIGYESKDSVGIKISSKETLVLNIGMKLQVVEGETVVVTAQAKGQMAAINQQLTSTSIKNIVSSDKIREVPDVNAAESIGRLPGVALKRSGGEGNKIVVRGLSPKYSIIEVDGVRLSGVDFDRSVGLSIVSSEMLGGIELSKSLTPDKDADAIGGVVNLKLKEADEGFHYGVSTLGGYNGLESSFNNYKLTGYISNRFFNNRLGALLNLGNEQVNRSSDQFEASYRKNIAESDDLYAQNASISERLRLKNRNHGSLVLDFNTKYWDLKVNNFYSQMKNTNETRNNRFRFNSSDFEFQISDSKPLESIRSHSMHNSFKFLNTVLGLDASYSDTRYDNKNDRYNFVDNYIMDGSSIGESAKLFAEPSDLIDEYYDITSSQKTLLLDNIRDKIKRRDETQTYKFNWKIPFRLAQKLTGNIKTGFKYSKKERRSDTNQEQVYYWGGIGIGRVRDIVYPTYPDFLHPEDVGITSAEGLVGYNFDDPDYDYGEILNGRYELGWSADLDKLKDVHDQLKADHGDGLFWYKGVESNRDDYQNTEEMTAAYIMTEINLGSKIMLLPGVRYEHMHSDYASKYILQDGFNPFGIKWVKDVSAQRKNENWFPSINMKIKTTEWSDIRAAVYKSASRPDYRLLSPGMTANDDKTRLYSYNPYLKPSIAMNYDLGFSVYSNKTGLLTINGFYKEIDGLIYSLPEYQPEYFDQVEGAPESLVESLQAPRNLYDEDMYNTSGTNNNNFPVNNPNRTYFSGIEINWQTNFWYLPGLLRGLVLDVNYTMVNSKTSFPYISFTEGVDSSGFWPIPISIPTYSTRGSRMMDQPASLWNVRIGWDYKDFSSRLSFRYQGETKTSIDPLHGLLNGYTDDLFRIDFTATQKITKNIVFTIDLANINKAVDDQYYKLDKRQLPRRSEYYGFTSQFGLAFKF